MRVIHNLLGDGDVLLKGFGGGVDHNGGKAVVDAGLAGLKAVAVIQVQYDRQAGLDLGSLDQLYQVGAVRIGAGAFGNLQDHRGIALLGSLGDTLDDFHVVDIESADRIAAFVRFLKHFG